MPISPLQGPMAPHYEKGSSTNVGKLFTAKKSHHGWLHINDVTTVAKSNFAPAKFFAGCSPGAPLKIFWRTHAPYLLKHLNSCTLVTDTSPVSPT